MMQKKPAEADLQHWRDSGWQAPSPNAGITKDDEDGDTLPRPPRGRAHPPARTNRLATGPEGPLRSCKAAGRLRKDRRRREETELIRDGDGEQTEEIHATAWCVGQVAPEQPRALFL